MRRRWRRRSLKRWLRRWITYLILWAVDVVILAALGAAVIFVVVVMLDWR
jgi:hypothetical protein